MAAAFLLLAWAVTHGNAETVTPVAKVITLLTEMLEKGKSEMHEEQVQFATYKQFCDDTTTEKARYIEEAANKIETLKADIQKAIADSAQLTKEVTEHDADVAVWKGDEKAATKVREIQRADYDATHKDYSESNDALQRAIAILKKQAYSRPQASLVELSNLKNVAMIPEDAKRAINMFLTQEDPELAVSAPEAAAYDFQSSGVIDMLEKLLDKFIDERTELEKEETNSRHAYSLLMQDLKAQVDQATLDRGSKAELKAKTMQVKADAEGDLGDTSSTKGDDEAYLSNLKQSCGQKASDFTSRQTLRTEELQAIEKAVEILSSDTVSGASEKHLPSLVQNKAHALALLRSQSTNPLQEKIVRFLRQRGNDINSRVLSALALKVEADPFAKVKKMIHDLITRLMESANEEAEHKGWCDTELASNEQTRKEKTEAVEVLHADIDGLGASIAKLTNEVSELTTSVSELDTAVAKATEIRHKEKTTNEATIKDSSEAQTAVAQALVILRDFYVKAGESTALVQKQPDIFDSPYQGMGAENGGVVGMLEVIESDFARLQAETEAAENTAQREYDTFMTTSSVDKAQKSKDIEHKTAKKQDENQALTTKHSDLEGTQKELDASLAYYDKLKPSCVDSGVSYDDRVGRRKEEIESLQEALRILSGEDIA